MLDQRRLRRAVREERSLRRVSVRFGPPGINVPLVLGGRRVIPDFRWAAQQLVVEADGAAWHDNRIAREDDAERQAVFEAHGERLVRVTWEQAVARPGQTLARIRAAGAPPAYTSQRT